MKNLYPKSKAKKIHPIAGDVTAVLKLLPAAIVVLTVALSDEDKEVLAYLVNRAVNGAAGDREEPSRPPCGRKGAAAFDCGCFECYTWFWSRWDTSPDRELIHQVIEAFEEHLLLSERHAGRGRRREKVKKAKNMVEPSSSVVVAPPAAAEEERVAAVVDDDVAEPVEVVVEKRRGWADFVGGFNLRFLSLWSPAE